MRAVAVVFLALFPFFLFSLIYFKPNPYQRIDLDYHFTLSAIMNHGTPDLRPRDFDDPWIGQVYDSHPDPFYCMRYTPRGVLYGDHFWLWPAICAPAALVFRAIGLHPLASHPFMTGLLLWLVLIAAWKKSPLDPPRRLAFILAGGLTPAIGYIWVFGSEAFVYVAMLACATALSCRRFDAAAACAAAASLQNSAIAPYALVLAFFHFATSRKSAGDFAVAAMAFSPALISPIFYMLTFGRPSLFAGVNPVSIGDASIGQLWMFLFDLDAGLVLFMSVAVALFFIAFVREGRALLGQKKEKIFFTPNVAALVGVVLIALTVSVWINWNSGYMGPNRMAVFVIPLLLYLSATFRPAAALVSAGVTAVVTLAWLGCVGFAERLDDWNYLSWGPVSRAALRYAPALCGVWSDEVMFERTFGHPLGTQELDGGSRRLDASMPVFPIVYYDAEWGARKILTTPEGWRMFRRAFDFGADADRSFGFIDERIDRGGEKLYYFNMAPFRKAPPLAIKRLDPEAVRYAMTAGVPEAVEAGGAISFDLRMRNDGDMPLMPLPPGMRDANELRVLCGLARVDEGYEYREGDGFDLVLHATLPLPDAVAPGNAAVMPVRMTAPGPGVYLFVALFGQGDDYFMTERGHGWFRKIVRVRQIKNFFREE